MSNPQRKRFVKSRQQLLVLEGSWSGRMVRQQLCKGGPCHSTLGGPGVRSHIEKHALCSLSTGEEIGGGTAGVQVGNVVSSDTVVCLDDSIAVIPSKPTATRSKINTRGPRRHKLCIDVARRFIQLQGYLVITSIFKLTTQ